MNKPIYAKFTNQGGLDYQKEESSKVFQLDKEYEIIGGYIGSWCSYFIFRDIEGVWNTSMFDKDWTDAEHLMTHDYRYDKIMTPKRYFMDVDNNGHHYIIEADKREEWNDWLNLDEEDETSWNAPSFCIAVDSPCWVEFENYIDHFKD